MKNNFYTNTINKLIYISLLTLIICLIFVVSKYIGLNSLISKIIKSIIPVFIAIFTSFLLEPVIGFFIKRKIKRKYSVLIVYGLIVIGLGGIMYFTIPSFIEQLEIFINNIPSLIQIIENFAIKLGITVEDSKFGNMIFTLSKNILNYLTLSFSVVFDILLGLSGAIFLSFDFPSFRSKTKEFIPDKIKEPLIFYFQKFLPLVHKYFLGIVVDTILIFIISIIGFSLIDIEYSLIISIFISITNLIPIIGPYIGGIPAVIIGFSITPTLGVSALVVVVIVQILESVFLQPIILKNAIELHPLEGILGISLFGMLFGIIGMILSPIIISGIKLLFLPYDNGEKIQFEIKN